MPADVSPAFFLFLGVAGLGGLVGGLLAGRSSGMILSVLMGMVGGLTLAAIARALAFPGGFDLGGFSGLYGALGGLVLAYGVASTSGRA